MYRPGDYAYYSSWDVRTDEIYELLVRIMEIVYDTDGSRTYYVRILGYGDQDNYVVMEDDLSPLLKQNVL